MQALSLALLTLLSLLYPLLVYFSIRSGGAELLAPLLLFLFALQWWLGKRSNGALQRVRTLSLLIGGLLALTALCSEQTIAIQFYPVGVNLLMLIVFGTSLYAGPPVIEQIARLQDPDLPPEGVRYTRRVTEVWCLFFIINGAIALYTTLANDLELWALYNGLISYLLMGTLFLAELICRRIMQRNRT